MGRRTLGHIDVESGARRLRRQPRHQARDRLTAFARAVAALDQERLPAGHRAPSAAL